MSSRKILVTVGPYETRAAILDNDQVIELFFETRETEKLVGCIFKGRVANVVPGTQSAFVDIGLEKDAYLTLSGIEPLDGADDGDLKDIFPTPIKDLIKVGQEALIQILKEPSPGKGPRSTMYLSLPGRYLVFMPTWEHIGVSRKIASDRERDRLRSIGKKLAPKGGGIIFRTAAEGVEERELQADFALLAKLWHRAEQKAKHCPPRTIIHRDMPLTLKLVREFFNDDVDRFIIDSPEEYKGIIDDCEFLSPFQRAAMELYTEKTPLFEKFGVEDEIRRALDYKVTLPSGAYLFIERTEALNSIDVNSGRFSGGHDLQETVFKVNLEAAKEIARQVRLRNLSGMIVIDFIDLDDLRQRKEVVKTLKDCLRGDRNRPNIYDMSELGLVQMTRRRASASLHEMLKTPCKCCHGRARVLSPLTLANRIRMEVIDTARQFEGEKVRVKAHPDVVAFFTKDNRANVIELEQRSKRTLELVGEPDRMVETYTIEAILPDGSVIDRTPAAAKHPSSSDKSDGERPRPSGGRSPRGRKPAPGRQPRKPFPQKRQPRRKTP